MANFKLPLVELSISQIFNGERAIYEIPVYQRNYAWEKDEITTLVQDVYDAFQIEKETYFIGTLVTYGKGEDVYEVIDGQQRLTTMNLILRSLGISLKNKLTFRARKRSNNTIRKIDEAGNLNGDLKLEDPEQNILNGLKYAQTAIKEVVLEEHRDTFIDYFQNKVHIIHYKVPKDVDLNHYFEVMNSRGEQLEKHEIIKARLLEILDDSDKPKFNRLWENCSEMNVYIQQKYDYNTAFFGKQLSDFSLTDFDSIPDSGDVFNRKKISDILKEQKVEDVKDKEVLQDTFQPIIDFPNFLLIVLKITRLQLEEKFSVTKFILDDKELIREFNELNNLSEEYVKKFSFNLLKCKFLLDNYVVHHSNDEDVITNNPWQLQTWHKDNHIYKKNLSADDTRLQDRLVHLLSMFEVSFTARQRKNYLFYCLLYLIDLKKPDLEAYCKFLEALADKYFKDIYLVQNRLNNINTPKPDSFDAVIILKDQEPATNSFAEIYGDGKEASRGVPLFVFNYLDYKLWKKYDEELRGARTRQESEERKRFFEELGCSDFGLDIFNDFYFSRTRRSLEHFFPQALIRKSEKYPDDKEINCFGNYAMIGAAMNSSGSDWSPATKLTHYLDASQKVKQVSVASLKFRIMMQKCENNREHRERELQWNFEDIKEHQENMMKIFGIEGSSQLNDMEN